MIGKGDYRGALSHYFEELDEPFMFRGDLITWSSNCGREFTDKKPKECDKITCPYCKEIEQPRML